MATTGQAFDNFSGRSNSRLRVAVALDSTDVANNATKWDFSLRVENVKGSSATWSGVQTDYSINIGGQTFSGTTPAGAFDFRDGADYHNIRLGTTGWIAHNADGTKTLSFSGRVDDAHIFGDARASGSIVAPRIPRGPRVRVNGVWRNTVAYVRVGGVWRIAIPYVRQSGTWRVAGG